MRYDGEAFIRLHGNEQKAKELIPRARTLYGQLLEMEGDRAEVKYEETDNYLIRIIHQERAPIFDIVYHFEELEEKELLQLHGLVEVKSPGFPYKIDPSSGEIGVDRFYPREVDFKTGQNIFPGWRIEKDLVFNMTSEELTAIPSDPFHFILDSLMKKRPGQFSGEMRQVVQILIGQNLPISFEYGFYKTHGIYVASNQTRWIIEISQGGVYARLLDISEEVSFDDPYMQRYYDVYGYYPIEPKLFNNQIFPSGIELQQAIADKSVIQLLDSSGVSEFYTLIPYFNECGWAFAYNKGEAQNTGYSRDSSGYRVAKRYKISIFEDTNAKPSFATLTKMSEGILWSPSINNIKIPDYSNNGNISLNLYENLPDPFPGSTAPLVDVYVFYNRSDAEVLLNYHGAQTLSSIVKSEISDNIDGNNLVPPPGATNGKDYHNGTSSRSIAQGPEINLIPTTVIDDHFSGTLRHMEVDTNTWDYSPVGKKDAASKNSTINRASYLVRADLSQATKNQVYTYSVIIPFYDRECLFYAEELSTEYFSTVKSGYAYLAFIGDIYTNDNAGLCTPGGCAGTTSGVYMTGPDPTGSYSNWAVREGPIPTNWYVMQNQVSPCMCQDDAIFTTLLSSEINLGSSVSVPPSTTSNSLSMVNTWGIFQLNTNVNQSLINFITTYDVFMQSIPDTLTNNFIVSSDNGQTPNLYYKRGLVDYPMNEVTALDALFIGIPNTP